MIHYLMNGTRPHPSANQGTVSQFALPVVKEPLTKDCLNRPQVGRQLCRGIGGKCAGGGVQNTLSQDEMQRSQSHLHTMPVKEGHQP